MRCRTHVSLWLADKSGNDGLAVSNPEKTIELPELLPARIVGHLIFSLAALPKEGCASGCNEMCGEHKGRPQGQRRPGREAMVGAFALRFGKQVFEPGDDDLNILQTQ